MNRDQMSYAGLGLALTALIALAVALAPTGDPTSLPEPLQDLFPSPGDSVLRQASVEIDLPVGYAVGLVVDGRAVPASEIAVTPSTGVWRWQPAPGASIEEWSPGEHTVTVTWDRTAGRPDPGEFTWTFRVS
jgi:hypothetical protein